MPAVALAAVRSSSQANNITQNKNRKSLNGRRAFVLLAGLLFVFSTAPLWALEAGERPFGGPLSLLAQNDYIDYSFTDVPGNGRGVPAMTDNREGARVVVAKTEHDTWSVNERAGIFTVGDKLQIPGGPTVPDELYSFEMGAGYSHTLDAGKEWGLNMTAGSDSDRLFNSIHETVFRATANYRLPTHDSNAWLFFLSYSNNRHFLNNVPLPGVGYAFASESLHLDGMVGFPFVALRWRPIENWTAQLSVFGPRNLTTEISRRLVAKVRAYGMFQWASQEWLTIDRPDTADRLFFDRKKAGLGLRSPLPGGVSVDVSGGRQFDQRFFMNDSSSHKDVPTLGLAPAWYIDLKLGWRFGQGGAAK